MLASVCTYVCAHSNELLEGFIWRYGEEEKAPAEIPRRNWPLGGLPIRKRRCRRDRYILRSRQNSREAVLSLSLSLSLAHSLFSCSRVVERARARLILQFGLVSCSSCQRCRVYSRAKRTTYIDICIQKCSSLAKRETERERRGQVESRQESETERNGPGRHQTPLSSPRLCVSPFPRGPSDYPIST